jgi:UDP-glucuronate 4-epimerase
MTILVTGAAGFIGFHTARALLERGERVVGVDDMNDYYAVSLKEARLKLLETDARFTFVKGDIADRQAMEELFRRHATIDRVVHLAAQAGVRYSLTNPYAYTRANVEGHLVLLEAARRLKGLKHFVYASSSSVYGSNTKLPFTVADRTDTPVSLYAATKKAMEAISHSYSHLYGIPQTGLRFFTVYGPWGRPDMAAFIFATKLLKGEPIPVYNNGEMRRDFTYIDDIVAGVVACLDRPPVQANAVPARLYNLGNNRSEPLMRFIQVLEQALGKKAEVTFLPMQPGDVKETFADITDTQRDFGFQPKTPIDEGIPRFVTWFRGYYNV